MVSTHPLCTITGINVCVYVKEPVVRVKSLVDYGNSNTKTPCIHCRLGSMTVAAGFPWGKQPEFPMGEIQMGQYSWVVKNKTKQKNQWVLIKCQFSDSAQHWSKSQGLIELKTIN